MERIRVELSGRGENFDDLGCGKYQSNPSQTLGAHVLSENVIIGRRRSSFLIGKVSVVEFTKSRQNWNLNMVFDSKTSIFLSCLTA